MAEGAGAEIFSGLRGGGGSVPTEGAGGSGRRGFAAGEERDSFGAEDGVSTVEHGVGEAGKVFGGREKAGVAGNAAQHAGVFILDFALDDFLAKGAVVGGGRDLSAGVGGRIECSVDHGERAEEFALAENVERFCGDAFESGGKKDESN